MTNSTAELKFSVIIPVYNRERYVADAIASVMAQEGDDYEVIVVDDGSTDTSVQIVEGLLAPRLRLIKATRGGGAAARNLGIAAARGEFIVWIDSDDRQARYALRDLRRAMQAHPDADVYYGDLDIFDDEKPEQRWQTRYPDYVGESLLPRLIAGNCLPNPGTAVRRALYAQHGNYDIRFTRCHDFHLWTRVADTARFKKVDAVLCHWRQHSDSLSNTKSRAFEAKVAMEMVERYAPDRLYPDLADDPAARGQALHRASDTVERLGEIDSALRLAYAAASAGVDVSERIDRLDRRAGSGYQHAFTVVLTTFDRPHLLVDALESLRRQTFRDFDVILVNDHGKDVEPLLSGYPYRITYLRQPLNMGPAAARNAAHRLAKGQHLVYLDDDDIFLPEHLQTLSAALRVHPDAVVYTDALFVVERIENGQRHVLTEERRYQHDAFSHERLCVDNYIPVNTFAWPRTIADAVGGFDESLSGLEDWDFLLRLASHVPFHHVGSQTVEVRMRQPSGGDARRSEVALPDYPALYRTIYARHCDLDSALVRSERAHKLAGMGTDAGSAPTVSTEQWLAARVLTPAQSRCFDALVRGNGGGPRIGILILDRQADTAALERTLRSLQPMRRVYDNIRTAAVRNFSLEDEALLAQLASVEFVTPAQSQNAALNDAAAQLACDWIMLVGAGECFTPNGLLMLAQFLIAAPDAYRAVYGDEMMTLPSGELSALLRPGFNLDLLLSAPSSIARHWCFRYDAFHAVGGFCTDVEDSQEFALVLALIDQDGLAGLAHLDEPLLLTDAQALLTTQTEIDAITAHLRGRGYENATVASHLPGCYRIDYGHQTQPGVSIVVPTRNQLGLLQRCIESVLEKTAYSNYEILIVDNDSSDVDARGWLDGVAAMGSNQLQVLRHPGTFDYPEMINLAARHARGEYLLLLDNDTAVLGPDWLDALLNHAQRPEVGIVGAKLLNPDGTVQHAGSVLGLQGPASPAFVGEKLDAPGYMYRLQLDQNYSAVSGSCLMVRKSLFDEVGGLEGGPLRNAYNDTDLCLKVGQAGYLVVWTPHALLLHEGGASQVREDRAPLEAKAALRIKAQDAMYAKWLPRLAHDPAYNRNLSLNGKAFRVETETTFNWNPLPWRPLPVALALPADRFGCGHYRVIQPAAAMNTFGIADVRVGDRYCTPVEMERLAPDVVVLQRQMLKGQLEPQKRMLRFSRSFKVAELDDYLPNVPMKSAHKGQLPSDVLKTMRDALKLVDRFIVSTAPLAEALDGLHPDIRVVENRLPLPWWESVTAQRRQGQRPRVGWGGGAGHRGDLELIADVVRELADEVEWVFLGMCPDKLRPYVHEFHPGVAIEDYPARLAGLDLDLALAPLEDNLFNRCKSNLRLLEYGACGYPVVCSDVTPYRGDLPVTRVKPRFRDWVEAIRMHTQDLDAAARAGDALRAAVHRDWMLDDAHAALWLSQWLPD